MFHRLIKVCFLGLAILGSQAEAADYILTAKQILQLSPSDQIEYIRQVHQSVAKIESLQTDISYAAGERTPAQISAWFESAHAAMLQGCLIAGHNVKRRLIGGRQICARPPAQKCGVGMKGVKCNVDFFGIADCVEAKDIPKAYQICSDQAEKSLENFVKRLREDETVRSKWEESRAIIAGYCSNGARGEDQAAECKRLMELSESVTQKKAKSDTAASRDFDPTDLKCITGKTQFSLNMQAFIKGAQGQKLCPKLQQMGNAAPGAECLKVSIGESADHFKVNGKDFPIRDLSESSQTEFFFGGNGKEGFLERLAKLDGPNGPVCEPLRQNLKSLSYKRLMNDQSRCLGASLPPMVKETGPAFYQAMAKVVVGCSVDKVDATDCSTVSGCMGANLTWKKTSVCKIQVCKKYFCNQGDTTLNFVKSGSNVTVQIPKPGQFKEETQWLKGWDGWTGKFAGVAAPLKCPEKFEQIKEPGELMKLFMPGNDSSATSEAVQ